MPLAEIAALLRAPSAEHLDAWAERVETDVANRREALAVARQVLAIEAESFATPESREKADVMKLKTATRVDIGLVRDNNEDAVVESERLVGVADGMGGGPGGEIASAIAADLIQAAFAGESLDELRGGARAANRAIWARASTTVELEGMGSTLCVVGLTDDGALAVVNVGDSRAYVFRTGELKQLTDDHTVTAEMVRRGELSERDSLSHPHRNVLTRVLGVGPDVELDAVVYAAEKGDRVLVCTDGLFNEVSDQQIASVIDSGDVQAVADALVELALSAGARDNVAVVVAEVSAS